MNVVAGITEHDAGQGSLAGAFSTLDDTGFVQNAQGAWVWRAPKSWHFTIDGDGDDADPASYATVYQHYPLTDSCWHTGVYAYNARQIGVEHIRPDGVNATVLKGAQLRASVRLARWIADEAGWPQGLLRDVPAGSDQRTLWQHNELTSTGCPSGRIPWDAYTSAPAPSPPGVPAPLTGAEAIELAMVTAGYVPPAMYPRRYELLPAHFDSTGGRIYTLRVQP